MSDEREITFTQFLLPNGSSRDTSIKRPGPIADMADKIIKVGGRFTVEVLSTGVISLACEYGTNDIAIELCDNGPGIPEAVDKLIHNSASVIDKWVSIMCPTGIPHSHVNEFIR